MARILIHWHPQFSYFFRCFEESARFFQIPQNEIDADVLMGPTFLPNIYNISKDFVQFLRQENISGLSINQIIIPPEFLYNGKVHLDANREYSSYDGLFDPIETDIFNNAVHDSVSRSIFSDLDPLKVRIDEKYNQSIMNERRKYSSTLLNYYLSILQETKTEFVCINHGNFDLYVNLYLAARRLNIPTLVLNGGHSASCIATNNKLVDICPSAVYDSIFDYFDDNKDSFNNFPDEINNVMESKSISFSRTGASCWEINKNNTNLNPSQNPFILAMTPILAEVQNRDCLEFMNYQSKSDWIKEIIRFSRESNMDIVFYLHPDLQPGFEISLVTSVISTFASQFSATPLIIKDKKELAEILQRRFAFTFSPSGTIASELASLGGKSIISNYCTACKIPGSTAIFNKFTHISDIYASYFSQSNHAQDLLSSKQMALQNTSKFYKAIGKFNPSKLKLQTALDKIFIFGDTKTKAYIPQAISSMVDSFSNLNHGYIDTKKYRVNYYYGASYYGMSPEYIPL